MIVVKKVPDGRCGISGAVGAGARSHQRPRCRNSAVVGRNRALGALWETSVFIFQTGGRVGAECVPVFVVASVPTTLTRGGWGRRSPPLAALSPLLPPTRRWVVNDRADDASPHAATGRGRGRGGGDRGGSRRHGHDTGPPLQLRRSHAPAEVVAGRPAPLPPPAVGPHRAAYGGVTAGLGRPSRRRGARPRSGLSKLCPQPPMIVAPAACRPLSTPRTCLSGRKPLLAAPMVSGAAASAPPHSAWQRRRARVGSPADRWGGGSRSGAPRATPRTEAPHVCTWVQQQWRATSTAHARFR